MAKIELSVLARQCLDRRIPDQQTLAEEVGAWEVERNAYESSVDWRFTTQEARIKLKHLYPEIVGLASCGQNASYTDAGVWVFRLSITNTIFSACG